MSFITRIHIEYADGNTDEIDLLRDNNSEAPVYWLARKARPTQELAEGVYSIHSIAGFLYQTAMACQQTGFDFAFDFRNPKTPSPAKGSSSQAA